MVCVGPDLFKSSAIYVCTDSLNTNQMGIYSVGLGGDIEII